MYFLSTSAGYHGISGVFNFVYLTIHLKCSVQDISLLSTLVLLMTCLKPFFGTLIDAKRIFGLKFTPYILGSCVVQFACCILIYLLEPEFWIFSILRVTISICQGFYDVVGEGLVALNTKLGY